MIWLRLDNLNALMGTVLEAVNKHKEDDDNFPVQEPTASYNTFMESECQLQASEAMRKKAGKLVRGTRREDCRGHYSSTAGSSNDPKRCGEFQLERAKGQGEIPTTAVC